VLPAPPAAVRDATDELSKAVARGALLPEDPASAFGILPQLPAEAERRLRVAMEDQGQQIVSRYLEGDQVPQIREDFFRCARLFEESAKISPCSPRPIGITRGPTGSGSI
jgi:hypothetical protein